MHWGLAGCLFLLFQELSLCSLEHGGLTVVRLHEWSQSSRSQLQEFSRPSTRRPQMPHSTDRATTKGQPGLRGGQGGCCLKRPTSHSWHWPRQWPGGPKLPGQQAEDKLLSIDSCWFVKQKEKWVPFRWICSVCDIYIYISCPWTELPRISFEYLHAQSKYMFIQYHGPKYVGDKVNKCLPFKATMQCHCQNRYANIYKSSSMQKLL